VNPEKRNAHSGVLAGVYRRADLAVLVKRPQAGQIGADPYYTDMLVSALQSFNHDTLSCIMLLLLDSKPVKPI
jgi:hypothetical protein